VDIIPAGLKEADFPSRVVIDSFVYSSTLNKELRLASFGEFDGWNTAPNPPLARDLQRQAGRMYPSLKQALRSADTADAGGQTVAALPKGMEIRTGLRPFVCDGRLLLGKIPEYDNLHVNVGPGFNGWKVASGAAKVLAADITGDSSALPDTFETSMLSPEGRIKYSPWFCRLVDLFTYNY
jgi:glycine/D-amino acid oxidase-like deaminating enzyme